MKLHHDPRKTLARHNARDRHRSRERRNPRALLPPAAIRVRDHAKSVLHEAIVKKQLIRPSACPQCSNTERRIEARQPDFTKPLEVEWLCRVCNKPRRAERVAAYKAAMAAGGGVVAGLWIAGAGASATPVSATPAKTLQGYSRKRGARGGDAATRLAVVKATPNGLVKAIPTSNAVVQNFIAADIERYLSGQPSIIAEVLAGKGAAVVVTGGAYAGAGHGRGLASTPWVTVTGAEVL